MRVTKTNKIPESNTLQFDESTSRQTRPPQRTHTNSNHKQHIKIAPRKNIDQSEPLNILRYENKEHI